MPKTDSKFDHFSISWWENLTIGSLRNSIGEKHEKW